MLRFVTLTIGVVLTVSFVLAQESATFEGLGDLPGGSKNSWAIGVSADGTVVSGISSSSNGFYEAVRWENGTLEGLGDFPGGSFYSVSYGVSGDGSVLVGTGITEEGSEAFRWIADPAPPTKAGSKTLVGREDGEMIGLGDLPGGSFYSEAFGISADGSVVVGGSESGNGTEAFRWEVEADTMVGLGDYPDGDFQSWAYDVSGDGSVVVGYGKHGTAEASTEAFRWEAGVDTLMGLGDLPGGAVSSVGWAISADGSVVVGQSSSSNGFEAFRWTEDGGMEGLGDLPGGLFFSYAQAVSADGSLVGGYSFVTNSSKEAFIWSENEGIRNLKDVLEEGYGLDLSGWTLISVRDVSDDGTVLVGEGINPGGDSEGWRAFLGKPVADEATPGKIENMLSVPNPNPARGSASLTLRVTKAQNVTVEIFDALGRHVQTLFEGAFPAGGGEKTLTLDASTLPAGLYAIRAAGVDFARTRPITIVH